MPRRLKFVCARWGGVYFLTAPFVHQCLAHLGSGKSAQSSHPGSRIGAEAWGTLCLPACRSSLWEKKDDL